MHKYLYIFILLVCTNLGAQNDHYAHYHTFGSLSNDVANDITMATDGGYLIVGSTASSGDGNTDIYLLKVDTNCSHEWSLALGEKNNDVATAVVTTSDNGYLVAANSNSYGNGGYDVCLFKRDEFGQYQWRKCYGLDDWDFVYDLKTTKDNGFVFCGETYNNTAGFSDVYVVKVDSIGDTVWTKTIGADLIDKGNALFEDTDSNIVVCGITNNSTDSTQAYIIKLDKDGNILWERTFGGAQYEELNDGIQMSTGDYVFFGGSNTASANDDLNVYILKLDVNGNLINEKRFNAGADDVINTVTEYKDGRLLASGYTKSFGAGKKDWLVYLVEPHINNSTVGVTFGYWEDEVATTQLVAPNGRIIIGGYTNSFGFGGNDVQLVRLDTLYNLDYGIFATLTQNEDLAPISVKEVTLLNKVNISPNPTSGIIKVNLDMGISNKATFELIDLLGRSQFSTILNKKSSQFNIEALPSQVYMYRISSNNRILSQGKIVKN